MLLHIYALRPWLTSWELFPYGRQWFPPQIPAYSRSCFILLLISDLRYSCGCSVVGWLVIKAISHGGMGRIVLEYGFYCMPMECIRVCQKAFPTRRMSHYDGVTVSLCVSYTLWRPSVFLFSWILLSEFSKYIYSFPDFSVRRNDTMCVQLCGKNMPHVFFLMIRLRKSEQNCYLCR